MFFESITIGNLVLVAIVQLLTTPHRNQARTIIVNPAQVMRNFLRSCVTRIPKPVAVAKEVEGVEPVQAVAELRERQIKNHLKE